jgi:hypothetical protein
MRSRPEDVLKEKARGTRMYFAVLDELRRRDYIAAHAAIVSAHRRTPMAAIRDGS